MLFRRLKDCVTFPMFALKNLDTLFSYGHSLLQVDLNFNSKHFSMEPDLLQNNIPDG